MFLRLYERQAAVPNHNELENSSESRMKDDDGEAELILNGSVFGETILRLQDLKEHMINTTVKDVVQGFRMLSKSFKKDR